MRAYKLSKYPNGQPGKLLLEARKVKRATSQFMSKNGAKEAAKRMKALKETTATTKKVSDNLKKAQDFLFQKILGSDVLDKASRVGGILGILSAIGVVALTKLQEFVSDKVFENLDTFNIELTKINTTAVQNGLKLKNFDTKLQKIERELDANAKDYYRLNKQQESFGKNILETKKQANDALYEAREGRKIVTGLAESARKLANDTLYEFRQNKIAVDAKITEQRISFDAKIQSINATISKFNNSVSDTFQKSVNATISKLQSDFAATKAQVSAIKPQNIDTNSITANAIAVAKSVVAPLQSQIANTNNIINGLQSQTAQIPVLANFVSNLGKTINAVDNKADAAMNEARSKGVPNLAPIQQQLDDKFNRFVADNNKALGIQDLEISNLSKDFDKKLADFNRLNNLSSEQRFQEFQKQNDKALGTLGLEQSKLSQDFNQRFADFKRQSELTSDQRFEEFDRENKRSLGLLKGDLQQLDREIDTTKADITKIDTKLKEQTKVNEQALPKLDQILDKLPFILALAAAAIRPDIPTIPQIENAAATGTCRTTQPGGCMRRALDDSIANINQNTNNRINALDVVNTGANTALLMGQQTILQRLGNQLPGGLSGTFGRLWQTLQVDRILNILVLITTFHNAAMLSNNIIQTLFSGIDNLGQAVGFKWKNEEGNEVGFSGIISEWTGNFFESIFGATTLQNINTTWNAANRTYQSVTNALWNIQGMFDSLRSIGELAASYTGKIGNALKRGGALFEDAFPDMTEVITARTAQQAKWDAALQNIQPVENVVSAFSQVTGEIVSIGDNFNELKNQRDEFFASKAAGETAVTQLVTGEKAAAQVNQPINRSDVQKSD
ncbi:hypothetical protein A6S26_24255 [Nostoc sp. ATCC 43529]|nr:hypothetical protein A6S26_24255 [Nostoc sp. ATCC 43529]